MVKSAKSHHDDEDDHDGYDSASFKGEGGNGEGKSSEQKKGNSHRSKHSETEQRRRSKINERFQILRDLIPENDQKRDKASFLLEVIEYIQFLQEKLRMYEGTYQGWSQEPAKLIPWKNHQAPVENLVDNSQVMRNGSAQDNTALLTSIQSTMESDLDSSAIYKALDQSTETDPFNLQTHSNMFAPAGGGGVPTQSLQESVSDADDMAYHLQRQLWQAQPSASECAALNSTFNEQQELAGESESVGISSAYSQGILNSLTQALRSSGVDLSQTNISVQIDVGKRANSRASAMGSSSRDRESQYLNDQVMEQHVVGTGVADADQAHKRLRTDKS